MNHYVLDGHTPVSAGIYTWARWFEKAERHVANTQVNDIRVSTVFLGMDHSFGHGDPLLFETMIFGGEHDNTKSVVQRGSRPRKCTR